MTSTDGYKLVRLRNGAQGVHSLAYHETMHPGLGPAAEAEALYVRQLKLRERLRGHAGEFIVWDIGLGAAANALTVLRATRNLHCPLRLVSFDNTAGPLAFALEHRESLGYFDGYEASVTQLLKTREARFTDGAREVNWLFCLGDFPSWVATVAAGRMPAVEQGVPPGGTRRDKSRPNAISDAIPGGGMPPSTSGGTPDATFAPAPHAILFDAFSPARNPAMWTLPLFTNLFRLLDPQRPCALTTYSRSTILRVTLLLAGFFVGRGIATGLKEETTVAANALELVNAPLDGRWLERARRSKSAEPLTGPDYRQAPLSAERWEKLQAHLQFSSNGRNGNHG